MQRRSLIMVIGILVMQFALLAFEYYIHYTLPQEMGPVEKCSIFWMVALVTAYFLIRLLPLCFKNKQNAS